MARAATSKPSTVNDERLKLIEALKFAALAVDKNSNSGLSEYVAIRNHWLMTENETFCIGTPVTPDLDMCLHAEKFTAALGQCGGTFQLTQLSAQELSIKSDKFRAVVPVLPPDTITPLNPDAMIAEADNRMMQGFETCIKAVTGKMDRAYDESVLLRANSIIATNGAILIEYWHGIDFPQPMAIPKKTIETLVKIGKPLAGFGFTFNQSVTFYFADESFLKTKLIAKKWPDNFDKLLHDNSQGDFAPLWPGFVDGLNAINKFVVEDVIHFHAGIIATHANLEHAGASYAVPSLPAGYKFSAAYWRICAPLANRVKAAPPASPFAFASDNVRGLIMPRH